ncbi:MAG: nicotinate-nucleotide--dimethylbenzimidazole phosphoribosyltransferase [Actinomycetota bacterium]
MDEWLAHLLADLPEPDEDARAAVISRAEQILRPRGALRALDELASWLAAWQRSARPEVNRPAVVLFVADHGVASEGVSAYPPEVTASVYEALRAGVATAPVMARALGARLVLVDVGVGRPTSNIARAPALSPRRFFECFEAGRNAVAGLDADLIVLGEMGIGNTTAAAAVCSGLFGLQAEHWTGRGTGVDDDAYARKVAAVEAAASRVPSSTGPFEVLRLVGGAELVALAGAALEARRRSLPIVLDGFVVTAAIAPLELARPGLLDHCVAGHVSSEPGHRLLLDKLNKKPLLDLELRLGEGSGALLAVPLIRLAAAAVVEVATFAEWGRAR